MTKFAFLGLCEVPVGSGNTRPVRRRCRRPGSGQADDYKTIFSTRERQFWQAATCALVTRERLIANNMELEARKWPQTVEH
jgi:hypothetical protein